MERLRTAKGAETNLTACVRPIERHQDLPDSSEAVFAFLICVWYGLT